MSESKVIRLKGLKKVEIAPYVSGADVKNATFTEVGSTTPDSFVITKAEDSYTEEFIEEHDLAIDELLTQKGGREVTWSTKNVSSEVFQQLAGGTISKNETTNEVIWKENPNAAPIEVWVRATSVNGIEVTIPRVRIKISGDLKFSKNALSQLTIKGKQIMDPSENAPAFSIKYPAEPTAE